LGLLALAGYHFVLRPWQQTWGATPAEANRRLPGDHLTPHYRFQTTRAITIQAPAAQVWPWLVQIGYRRAGFYSYDALENMVGLNINSAENIDSELQNLNVGDSIPIAPEAPMEVAVLEPEKALVLHLRMNPLKGALAPANAQPPWLDWTWAFILDEIDPESTRLVIRVRGDYEPAWSLPLYYALVEPAHFIMERKMLLGIKQRAEAQRSLTSTPSSTPEKPAAWPSQ